MLNQPQESVSTTTTVSENTVFVEHEVASQRISVLTTSNHSIAEMDSALVDLRGIFDKYLEMPSLLDKHVETMVNKLATAARELMDDTKILTRQHFWSSSLPRHLSALYALSKVRGRKRIRKLLPHRVEDVHAILRTLQGLHEMSRNEGETSLGESTVEGLPQLWESIYVLWNWMAILSLVPFKVTVVIDIEAIDELVDLAKHYLSEAGPTREMASGCLASWISRPDLETTHLEAFQGWSDQVLKEYLHDSRDIILTMGILQTLVTIIKTSTSDRDSLLRLVTPLGPTMMLITATKPNNLLLRKYLIKWWSRVATLYMPPRVTAWRYQRGSRSLKDNVLRTTKSLNNTGETMKKSTFNHHKAPEEYELFLVPDQVEDALGEIISGLTDSSTIVRWSAAKGVGRVTERLPAICSDDVLDAILELFGDREKDNDWHGACLAMAELARRGLLLPHRLHEVVPRIVEAVHYDVPRRQTSVGAHVRDAACYTYWAIARAYSPEVLRPLASALSQSVVTAFLFDREVNCRRAASAAFQEFVGRQGATNFKNGISILTRADFFSLGNRTDAYLSIAPDIAQYDEYRKVVIDHLYQVKLRHWDIKIRHLSSQALGNIAMLDVGYFTGEVIPYLLRNSLDERDVQLRHGSVLGIAEIILAIGILKDKNGGSFELLLSPELALSTAELVPIIEKKRLYRGKGGEQMRAAVCRLIECIAMANIPLSVPLQVRLLDSIDACIPHPKEDIQEQATLALAHITRAYFPVGPLGPSDRLQKRILEKYVNQVKTSLNPAATRGFTMALGRLPAKLLAPSSIVLDLSLACLCQMSRPDATIGGERDAETRRNALVALARICNTVTMTQQGNNGVNISGLSSKQVGSVFAALFRGLDDYNMELRGDVGSMSRIASMHGLVSLAIATNSRPVCAVEEVFDEEICRKLVCGLLKQLVEKLDAVRLEAGKCLVKLLVHTEPGVPHIVEKGRLMDVLGITTDGEMKLSINWADASVTFPLVTQCLDIDEYFPSIVAGLVISVGCLTQSVAKEAGAAFVSWAKIASNNCVYRLGTVLLDIFDQHKHDGRVILPLLKSIMLLMNHRCIDRLISDSSFSSSLLGHLRDEESTCKDVHRLTAIIDVCLGLLGTENACQEAVLGLICKLLMHAYPRVRRIAAENFYIKLIEQPDISDSHPAIELLLTNPWEQDMLEEEAKRMATDIASLLNVPFLMELTHSAREM